MPREGPVIDASDAVPTSVRGAARRPLPAARPDRPLYLLLPASGLADPVFESWLDQSRDVDDLHSRSRFEARTSRAKPMSIPAASVLTLGFGTDSPRFSLYTPRLGPEVPIAEPCAGPSLVAAWPTIMGLPPDLRHLAAVVVRNVRGG